MNHETEHLPPELHPLDSALSREGERMRRQGAEAAARIAANTSVRVSVAKADRWRFTLPPLWLTLGAPLAAAAAVTLIVFSGGPSASPEFGGADILAADLEGALDVWMELDSQWSSDPLGNDIAVLSLEAAGAAAESGISTDVSGLVDADL